VIDIRIIVILTTKYEGAFKWWFWRIIVHLVDTRATFRISMGLGLLLREMAGFRLKIISIEIFFIARVSVNGLRIIICDLFL
jgi:hypothetical protein